jgi:hypothetical protein
MAITGVSDLLAVCSTFGFMTIITHQIRDNESFSCPLLGTTTLFDPDSILSTTWN